MGLGATLVTFTPSTVIKSADVNSNLQNLNNAATPTFTTVTTTAQVIAGTEVDWGAGVGGSLSRVTWDGTNHANVYWPPQSGASALGHIFVTWSGSAQVNAFSVGGQLAGSLAWFDNSGNLTITGALITGHGASITVGNGTNDILLTPGSGHWTYLNNTASASSYVDQAGNIHGGNNINAVGQVTGASVWDNGSRVAVQGAHSAGQPIVSYGTGAPASLSANEVYFQVA